jgi:flagellar basal-body rod protein FlgF
LKNIWVPLSGQIAQQKKVETIANNIANANTAGFKRDDIVFKEHLTALSEKGMTDIDIPREDWSPDDFYRTQGAENAYVKVDGTYTVHEQGELVPTGNNFDLALSGKGFFEVLTPAGIRYTRKGTFTIDREGMLVTDRGFRVLGKLPEADEAAGNAEAPADTGIEARFLKLNDMKKISISKSGDIYSPQGVIGGLSVVEFKDPYALKKQGYSLFVNNAKENVSRENIKTTVNQGFVEQSNVNALREMSELIKAHRHFDNIQKAINTYDAISGKAMNEIGKF